MLLDGRSTNVNTRALGLVALGVNMSREHELELRLDKAR